MKVLIAGAGWAGLACAIELVKAGHQITVIEASRHLGGRARALEVTLPNGETATLDNGQHILDVRGLQITDPMNFELKVSQWPGVVTVGVFALQKAHVCLLGTAQGVRTLTF